jgi:nitroimidazol reductase NimA-like FMN-containing flavoprotein (pyridoxamine 5'-phosphate oxidase superfamily)
MSAPSDRTRVKRVPERGKYDRNTINAILDEGLVCHVGFAVEGQPFVIPTGYARDGDRIIIHGSSASRMIRALDEGIDVCLTVTLLDDLVLARSAFHHSMNYRSVVVLGKATLVDDWDDKMEAMRILTEHLIPGRWDDCRAPNDIEMKATAIMEIPIDEASAKIRTGPPGDDDEDYALPHWAGLIPLKPEAGTPVPDPKLTGGVTPPDYVVNYRRDKK